MILVLFFLFIVLLISFIIIVLLLSNIQIDLDNIYISNLNKKIKVEFSAYLKIYFLNRVKLACVKIKKEKIKKMYDKNIKKLRSEYSKKKNRLITKIILRSKFILNKVYIHGSIGTEDSFLTAIIVGIINAVIPTIAFKKIRSIKKDEYYCNLVPVYINKNLINVNANIVASIKVTEILNSIIKIKKLRVDNKKCIF